MQRGESRERDCDDVAGLEDASEEAGALVFPLEEGEEVACVHCIGNGCHDSYRKGEAFLAGPDHTPYDGNANYVCRRHLDEGARIWEPRS